LNAERSPSDGGTQEPDPAAAVIARLRAAGQTLAVAESCTGGWLGRELTSVPGASAVFWGGVIAYDNSAKETLLSVSPQSLLAHGAVSETVAVEMASGVAALSGATWGVSITGLAGPDGATPGKPVGTVCVALAGPASSCHTFRFAGHREDVRREAVAAALGVLGRALEGR
jgi:nicotinamide-nucleotide amidase